MRILPILGSVAVATASALLPIACALWLRSHLFSVHHEVTPGLVRDVAPPVLPPPALTATLDVDPTQAAPPDPAGQQAVVDAMGVWQAAPNLDPALVQPPDWRLWARQYIPACLTRLAPPSSLPENALTAYATGGQGSCVVCLINHGAQAVDARVHVRLAQGVYTIERLTFTPGGSPAGNAAPPPQAGTARLERLEGWDLTTTTTVLKEGKIEPGQIVFYRYTDQDGGVRAAMWEATSALNHLASQKPGPTHRLIQMLDEASPFLTRLTAGTRAHSPVRRLEAIHGLLMMTAQAESLQRDYQMHGTVDETAGAAVTAGLQHLMDSLAEYTAVVLGLVPQVNLDASVAASGGPAAVTAQAPADRVQPLDLSLSNTGDRDISSVKLGFPATQMPPGVTCEPNDAAFFSVLKPGQTVHATFHIHRPGGAVVPGSQCMADVSYLAGGGPVHLRLRPW
jgi:hypothetical protein